MSHLYSSPLRVYLCLGALALTGVIAGLKLPVSLFPNSSKPIISAGVGYGNYTVSEFISQHGNQLESRLRAISTESAEVEKTRAHYNQDGVHFEIEFKWGTLPRTALREVETVVHSYSSQFPEELRNGVWVYPQNENSGFFLASFSSPIHSMEEVYTILEPVLLPRITKLKDVSNPELINPSEKEIRIELNTERMAAFQLMPKDIDRAVKSALMASSGGSITVGTQQLSVQVPRLFNAIEDLNEILVPTPSKQSVHLTDVAQIDYDLKTTNNSLWKTSGVPSLILRAVPRPGGNVKRMSEEIIEVLKETMPSMPQDIKYTILVDPSQFIRSAVTNVFEEVAIGATLAVIVLFLFIGSFKNTVTAAIEIPLSMVMAFIPMKLSGMSINLISLGGLALSAGMNVDASVVVMENIFRHFESNKGPLPLDQASRLKILVRAVNEVKFPVIVSTIASLVVFLPLAFTSDLTYAVLGDLAKAVVFSHGLSAFVALILVPTVRLQLMSRQGEKTGHSPVEKQITQAEDFYVRHLTRFIKSKKIQRITYAGLVFLLISLTFLVVPRLPKEVIGKPDTDSIFMNFNTQGNILQRQMETLRDEVDGKLSKDFGDRIQFTVSDVYQPNGGWILAQLKDKRDMKKVLKELETSFANTPLVKYQISPWNPAELPIPDPPQMRLAVRGGTLNERAQVSRDIYQLLEENQVFPRIWTDPEVGRAEKVVIKPYLNLWSNLKIQQLALNPEDLGDLVRVMTTGRKLGDLFIDGVKRDVFLRYSSRPGLNAEEIGTIPLGLGDKIIPLKALSRVAVEETIPSVYQEDQRELYVIFGKKNDADSSHLNAERLEKAETLVKGWKAAQKRPADNSPGPTIVFEDAGKDVREAMDQLMVAMLFSVGLIFLILMIQFGDIVNALLVLVAIPLGLIGVLVSLFVFRSTLSLNSMLGVILLNGIAVANSIILVDFLKRRVEEGLTPMHAALDAGKKRLRPILITSLTSILGMLPIALGFGEGGRILQPLGIAVSGGLWVSMGFTLFVVPALQVRYLNWKVARG